MSATPNDMARFAKNHFREEEYFSLNVKSGILRSSSGTRMLGIPEDLILGLHAGLVEETGEASGIVLYTCGKWWGQKFWKRHGLELRKFYGVDLADVPLHFQQQIMRRVFSLYGWGLPDTNFDLCERGFVEVTVQNAAYSDIVGNLGRTADHLLAGILAAGFSDLAGRELDATEIACRSKGDATCAFLVGMKARVNIAEAWMQRGRSRADIVSAVSAGELV